MDVLLQIVGIVVLEAQGRISVQWRIERHVFAVSAWEAVAKLIVDLGRDFDMRCEDQRGLEGLDVIERMLESLGWIAVIDECINAVDEEVARQVRFVLSFNVRGAGAYGT